MSSSDSLLSPGSTVYTKAKFVVADYEAKRLYRSAWKFKLVVGTVQRVEVKRSSARVQYVVVTSWQLSSGAIVNGVLKGNVKYGTPIPLDMDGTILHHGRHTDSDIADTTEETGINNNSSVQLTPFLPDTSHFLRARVFSASSQEAAPTAITVHGQRWKEGTDDRFINGALPAKEWRVISTAGTVVANGTEWRPRKAIDYFMMMFPTDHLPKIVIMTNQKLENAKEKRTTASEILRFFGVLILMTRFEISGSRRELWCTQRRGKYLPGTNFGAAMGRRRFDIMFCHITCSYQPIREATLSSVKQRWSLVNDFVEAINRHRACRVLPSDTICVDESIVRWYGLGGHWIDVGLPHYVALDRKPESGCEIQNAACGASGIILRLEIVTNAQDTAEKEYEGRTNHGTAVLHRLVEPWAGTSRLVCADSYFASVETAKWPDSIGLRFTGVVKTATRKYPMAHVSSLEMTGRGDQKWLLSVDEETGKTMMALCWVDRARRYFISTSGSVRPRKSFERTRWRQEEGGPRKVTVVVPLPHVVAKYYGAAAAIDQHNRCRQDDLGLERKVQVKDWSKRVNISLLSICIVDAWLLYKGGRGGMECLPQHRFYEELAEQLIEIIMDMEWNLVT